MEGHWNVFVITKHIFQVAEVSSENYSFPNLSHSVPYLSPLSVLAVTTAAFDYTVRSYMLNPNADIIFHPPLCH